MILKNNDAANVSGAPCSPFTRVINQLTFIFPTVPSPLTWLNIHPTPSSFSLRLTCGRFFWPAAPPPSLPPPDWTSPREQELLLQVPNNSEKKKNSHITTLTTIQQVSKKWQSARFFFFNLDNFEIKSMCCNTSSLWCHTGLHKLLPGQWPRPQKTASCSGRLELKVSGFCQKQKQKKSRQRVRTHYTTLYTIHTTLKHKWSIDKSWVHHLYIMLLTWILVSILIYSLKHV